MKRPIATAVSKWKRRAARRKRKLTAGVCFRLNPASLSRLVASIFRAEAALEIALLATD
jgi:hypothetical protein